MTNDSMIFDAMVRAIREGKRFGYVDWGQPDVTVPAVHKSTARILRTGFTRVPARSSNTEDQRIVTYNIEMRVRDSDAGILKERTHSLEAHLINLFHNVSIGGMTEMMFTLLENGRDQYNNVSTSERVVILSGQFTYLVVPGSLPEK